MHHRVFLILALAVTMTGVAVLAWSLYWPLGPLKRRIKNERPWPASPDDWPHLRGPNYDGVSTETSIAAAWPEEGPPILWTRALGQGYSGFVVVAGKAFTQFQQLGGQYLLCLDIETGDELWRLRYDRAWQPSGAYPGPYASPTWELGRVFFASPTGLAGCADAATGTLIWSRDLMRDFAGKGASFGYACTPLVEDGLVFFPLGGKGASVVALHAHDGSVAWQAGDDQGSYCPALPITLGGRRLLVAYLRNALVLHDLETGRIVSRQVLSSEYDEHSAWPLYREPHLVLTAPFRAGAQSLRLTPDGDDVSLKRNWTAKDLSNDVLSSVLHNGYVYGFDLKELQARIHRTSRGILRCLDFDTGQTRWSTDKVAHASVLVADGKLILLDDTGTLILARAAPTHYEELARQRILSDDGVCWTPPTLWHGRLLVRNQHRVVCVYLGDPAALDPVQRSQAVTASELPAARSWDWTALIGREPEFPNDAPSWTEMSVWYGASLAIFAVAGVLGGIGALAGRLAHRQNANRIGWAAFWLATFALAAAAPAVAGHALDRFVWTWPVCVYVAYQLTTDVAVWARRSNLSRAAWSARAAMLGMLSVGYIYFALCEQLGLSILWSFLMGVLPACPFAIAAARSSRGLIRAVWLWAAFTVFYWSAAAFLGWKALRAEEWTA